MLLAQSQIYFWFVSRSLIETWFLGASFSLSPTCPLGLSTEHPFVGLEAGRRCDLFGGAETGLHCPELFGARFLHDDGESVRYAVFQNGS